jgi:hypothetical protein
MKKIEKSKTDETTEKPLLNFKGLSHVQVDFMNSEGNIETVVISPMEESSVFDCKFNVDKIENLLKNNNIVWEI